LSDTMKTIKLTILGIVFEIPIINSKLM